MANMNDVNRDDDMLEAFFEAARDEAPVPSEALLAKIMADADAQIAQTSHVPVRPSQRRSIWAMLAASIGGWPALAGMATATAAGVWIGVAAPEQVSTMTGGLLGTASETHYELEELMPGYGMYAALSEVSE